MTGLNDLEKGHLCQVTCDCITGTEGSLRNIPGLLKKVIRFKAWERRETRGKVIELSSLRELITEKPVRGWGEDPKKIEALIRDDPEALSLYREAMKCVNQHDSSFVPGDNVTKHDGQRETGNSRAYSIDRVKREAPQFLDAVMAKEMSPNAALVQAGIRENRQVYIPREPAIAAEKLRQQFGDEWVESLAECIQSVPEGA
jgi:hypothetical protein